ncbi:Mur ligase family protein [Candidatus Thiosymbion oneisti]|uniref:Mur ligase family protein n=1 Tax=Candidatus Thiosymbion oneisti TaxID=589554 RepID=UPI000ACF0847|nr:Mur ligase family protein [Candidatus Thiosymbion oneisti]
MPSDPLTKLLAATAFAWRREPVSPVPLTDIQWRADACGPGSILFFQRLDDGRDDAELYRRYLADGSFSVLVTNRMLDCFEALPGKGIFVTRPADWPRTVGRFCDLRYPLPEIAGGFMGITGTNGKTTTVKYLESMLRAYEQRVLTVGTLGVSLNGEPLVQTGFTSPPQIELRRLLHVHRGRYDVVVLETSSHALDQGRLHGIPLRNAGWTNFSQDHLDYHRDEAAYFAAKARILDLIRDGGRLFCTSPEVISRLLEPGTPPVPIQPLNAANLGPEVVAAKPFLALIHNRENYALAAALADTLLGPGERPYWRYLEVVDGRFECRVIGNRTLIVDFAHTPAALETLLTAIRHAFPDAGVLTLFGCGGERDRGKRPLMGAAAARHSDHVILTSDNPRSEDPERIIDDILTGLPGTGREVVVERPQAVARLFDLLAERPADEPWVGLIAGKGHERYIDRDGCKTYYSDQDEVERNLRRLAWV